MGRRERGNGVRDSVNKSVARESGQEEARSRPELTQRNLAPELLRLEPIDAAAMTAYNAWPNPVAGYPWEDVHGWKQRDSKGLDLALWYDTQLCGLCYATPRGSRLTITLVLLERSAGPGNPLQGLVMAMMVVTLIDYAAILGCKDIVVQDPEAGAVPHYQRQGFAIQGSTKKPRLVLTV